MKKEITRMQRVSHELQKEIAIILNFKFKDPRIERMITVSGIEISRDLAYAKVFISFLNEQSSNSIESTIKILQEASGFIRSLLSKKISLRIIPNLTFFYDGSLLEGIRMTTLLTNVVKNDAKRRIISGKKEEA